MINIFKKIRRKPLKQFTKKNIPELKYGILHSRFGYPDGVSIVMKQIEGVLNKSLKVPKKNIFYLVGRSKEKSSRIIEKEVFWDDGDVEKLIKEKFQMGFGGGISEKIENAITEGKTIIRDFIKKNKINVIIAHNSSHPVNFIYSIALSRYYQDAIKKGEKPPKYILWWHDSHLERKEFSNPSKDVENYLLEGIPGNHVEHIIFINSLQFKHAKKYFKKLDSRNPGFYNKIDTNHDVVFNTTELFIKKFRDLKSDKFNDRIEKFIFLKKST